jgi:hypothetical protein
VELTSIFRPQLGTFTESQSLRSHSSGQTHWMATLPSTLPTVYASPDGKQETTLVCHFSGESIVYEASLLVLYERSTKTTSPSTASLDLAG